MESPLDGEPIKLPENLESLPRAEHFASQRHRWNTNEEIAAILISFDKHNEWQSKEVKIRPKSGSMLLYSRKKVRYRRDGYCWKKRKDGKTTREDHMKLKVQGTENPDIVLVHYLNVPYPDDNKLATVAPNLALWADKKEWTKDELVSQLKPMFFSEDDPELNNELEISTAETVEAIVGQLMEKQRAARAAALARQLECGCPDSTCQDSRTCAHPLRRISTTKSPASDHHVSSTTGPSPRPPRQYTREQRPAQPSPLLLSLGQIQGGGGLLIFNGTGNGTNTQQHSSIVQPLSVASFVCNTEEPRERYRQQYKHTALVLKREITESTHGTVTCRIESEYGERKYLDSSDIGRRVKNEPKVHAGIVSAPATPVKYIETTERSSSVISTSPGDDTLVLLDNGATLGAGSFFDETLELSHEDIQRTLSANMPSCELERSSRTVEAPGVESMDFIESVQGNSPPHVVDEDVFVNLDAFDMLGDFPEFEVLDPSSITMQGTIVREKSQLENHNIKSSSHLTVSITDYSPEWAYPEGGVKVLVAGPWNDNSESYTVLFDSFPVPTIMVQNGLLRCFCPAHEAGVAALQVARDGRVISDTVAFEYKPCPTPSAVIRPINIASASGNGQPTQEFLKFTLLQRLEKLHGRLLIKKEPTDSDEMVEDLQLYKNAKLEDRLVSFCKTMSFKSKDHWINQDETIERDSVLGGLLHISARLGYSKLTSTLLQWKQDDPSPQLQCETDLTSRDNDSFTPLMRASASGENETALILAQWSGGLGNATTINSAGDEAAEAARTARENGHGRLASLLDRIAARDRRDAVFRRPASLSRNETNKRSISGESNLIKRPSIDSGINMADSFRSNSLEKSDTTLGRWERSSSLPLDGNSDASEDSFIDCKTPRRMDFTLCETGATGDSVCGKCAGCNGRDSPLIDVEAVSEDDSSPAPPPPPPATPSKPAGEQDDRVFTLAEQIIAAMPERIKNESGSILESCNVTGIDEDGGVGGGDSLMPPLLDDGFNQEFNFELSDHNYRYSAVGGIGTPCSSESGSPCSAPSPGSVHLSIQGPLNGVTTGIQGEPPALLQEFLHATTHFSNLTLNDREQRELYSAAITIQKAFRSYRGRVLQKRAATAALTIQNCYRRYKQYAYLKQMNEAATIIQQGYREYKANMRNTHHNQYVKRTYSQRRENQAARKIQQFMRQSKIKLQRERAEREKVAQQLQDAQRNSPQRITSIQHTANRIIDYLSPESPMAVDDNLLLEMLYKE